MWWVLGPLLGLVLLVATNVGVHIMPMSAWWFARGDIGSIVLNNGIQNAAPTDNMLPVAPVVHAGGVTDLDRYSLARAAGFSALDAVTAAAISIAEDGSGDPAALGPPNRDGSRDLGLFQINSGHWPTYGGHDALVIPINNARAAYAIFSRAGWCSWSVYERSCGVGYTGAYAANLGRARTAAAAYGQ